MSNVHRRKTNWEGGRSASLAARGGGARSARSALTRNWKCRGTAGIPEDPFGSYRVSGGSAAPARAAAEPVHAVGHAGRGQHRHAVAELVGHRLVLTEPAALQRGR